VASDGKDSAESNLWHFESEEKTGGEGGETNTTTTGWTVMIYLDGDNNMDSYAQMELSEITSVETNENVTVLVLYDGRGDHNSHLYVSENKSFNEMPLSEINPDWSYGNEVNMGDCAPLREFIGYSMKNYPAGNYMLELWNHGNGWMGICRDENPADRLTMGEIKNAISGSCEEYGEIIDVLVYTACGMGEIECAYGLTDYVSYFVASEESVFATGLPHADILESIAGNTSMGAHELSEEIVNEYALYYQYAQSATISAWNMNFIENLTHAVDELAQILSSRTAAHAIEIEDSYYETESFNSIGIVDLYDFAFNIQKNFANDSVVNNASQAVIENVTRAIFYEWHGNEHQNAHGISIYFPPDGNYVSSYENTDFALHTHWDEFLRAFYGI
ncbi:MAG: clostripain-related cysteine peptidase, partial [Candidatus Thermoplasmatota archaeon]|nr:clostripain-related cysteine peptidase [Candidatus Thermoplasmatota archaeon]